VPCLLLPARIASGSTSSIFSLGAAGTENPFPFFTLTFFSFLKASMRWCVYCAPSKRCVSGGGFSQRADDLLHGLPPLSPSQLRTLSRGKKPSPLSTRIDRQLPFSRERTRKARLFFFSLLLWFSLPGTPGELAFFMSWRRRRGPPLFPLALPSSSPPIVGKNGYSGAALFLSPYRHRDHVRSPFLRQARDERDRSPPMPPFFHSASRPRPFSRSGLGVFSRAADEGVFSPLWRVFLGDRVAR